MKMNSAINGKRALLPSGIRKQRPAASNDHAMLGNVESSKFRLPKVSIVCRITMSVDKDIKTNTAYPYCRDRKDEVDKTKTEGGNQGNLLASTSLQEDARRVECNNLEGV